MTREIKFRAWDIKNKEMVGVRTIDFYDDGKISEIDTTTYCWSDKFATPTLSGVILMQFSGLKDKNGNDMYEGDIIKQVIKGHEVIAPFIWDQNRAQFGLNAEVEFDIEEHVEINVPSEGFPEVIGNIYQNPELLK